MAVKFHISFKAPKRGNSGIGVSRDNGIFLKGNNGATVILIHGLTGTPHEMSFIARFLNAKGYSVLCPLLANHAEPLEVLKNTKWQECYETIRATLKSIPSGSGPVVASGLSMGALLALLLAEEFPERVSAVSCLSPTLFYDGWNTPYSRHLLPFANLVGLTHLLYFKEEPPYGIKNEAIRSLVHKYYSKAGFKDLDKISRFGYPFFPATLLYEILLLARYTIKRLPQINTSVQLIQAKDDDMTSVKNSQFIYDRINSKVKEIVLLYNSYHVITADQEREKVAQEMERFFSRILQESLSNA